MLATVLFLLTLLPSTTIAVNPDHQCEPGFTGENCDVVCPFSCDTCDRVSQDCTGHCKQQHRFGKLCQDSCPKFCDGTCNITTGSCFRCSPSYSGTFCNISCPENCRSTCDINTMECYLCKPGFTGRYCNETCPLGCSSCNQLNSTCIEPCPDEGTYGHDCEEPCPENCRDGCYRDTGECMNCAVGFGGGSCNESCPANCINGCDRYQGTCNDCIVGYSGGRCSENCPANCNGGCYKQTAVCKSCGPGFMGQFCNDSCEGNCNNACDQTTGECTTCQFRFTGVFCDQTCSRYCRDECEQTLGKCIGCIDGHTGGFCNETCSMNCLGNCDQNTRECAVVATGNKALQVVCGTLGAALMVLGITVIIVLKRKQNVLLQNRRARVDAIPEANDDTESNSTGHRHYEIVDDNLANNREMVTTRSTNLPHQDVSLPPPLPSQRLPQVSPTQQDVHPRLPPPLPSQRIPRGIPTSKKDVNLQLPPPLPSQRKPPEKPQQDVDLLLSPPLPNQRDPQLISLTQHDLNLWSPCLSPWQQVQAKTSRSKTSRPLSVFGRNQRDYYLDAIFESNINSTSTFTEIKYYAIDENNLAKDSRAIVAARRNVTLPAPLPNPRSSLSGQDMDVQLPPSLLCQQDLSTRPKQDFCLLPSQEHPPLQQDVDLELNTLLPCQRNHVKSPRPRKINYHFDCDVIFENAIYESADEILFSNKEIIPPNEEDNEKQILLVEELEHLKHPVTVGGAPVVANPDIEVVPIPDVVTDDDDDNIVNEILETSV